MNPGSRQVPLPGLSAGSTPTPESKPAVVREEEVLLVDIRRRLEENPQGPVASESEIGKELVRLQEEWRDAKAEDKASISQQLTTLAARLDTLRSGRPTGTVDPDSPYFGHLRVEEQGKPRDVFLGRATRLGPGLRIVDWRNAPISRLFYRYDEGEEYYEELGGSWREGTILARRTVHIDRGELQRVGASEGTWVREANDQWQALSSQETRLAGGQGQALRQGQAASARLGAGKNLRANKHLPDIAALIDPEQFSLITAPNSGVVVLRGSAGSGKTTVALHRIAYLAFEMGHRFRADRVLVIVWGRAMRDYVAHVLPALGVEGVRVDTWTRWARKTSRRHFPNLPNTIAEDTPEPVTRIKLHPGLTRLLERRIQRTPGPKTMSQAVDDWASVISDGPAIAKALGTDISPGALGRAMDWCHRQTEQVLAWAEGDHKVDARLDAEDDALLLRAWQLRVGRLKAGGGRLVEHQHLVLDEVQDFSPVEVQVLLETCDKRQSVTLAGDTRQHISESAGFASWRGFLDRIGIESTALSTLEVAYRSTHAVTRFAVGVLDEHGEAAPRTTRDGPPVELFRFSDDGACVAFLAGELKRLIQAEPLANVALLTPTPELSRTYADGLRQAEVPGVRLVVDQKFAFAAGIDVVEANQVKGLEFDYVVIIEATARHYPDTPHHRRLLHVAATRAVHQLWLTAVGTPSSVLPSVAR